jgi:hypothetical protein
MHQTPIVSTGSGGMMGASAVSSSAPAACRKWIIAIQRALRLTLGHNPDAAAAAQ